MSAFTLAHPRTTSLRSVGQTERCRSGADDNRRWRNRTAIAQPAVRSDLINRVRAAIAAGEYDADGEKLDIALDVVMARLVREAA